MFVSLVDIDSHTGLQEVNTTKRMSSYHRFFIVYVNVVLSFYELFDVRVTFLALYRSSQKINHRISFEEISGNARFDACYTNGQRRPKIMSHRFLRSLPLDPGAATAVCAVQNSQIGQNVASIFFHRFKRTNGVSVCPVSTK